MSEPTTLSASPAAVALLGEVRKRLASLPPLRFDEDTGAALPIWEQPEREDFHLAVRDLCRDLLKAGGVDGLGGCLLCCS